MIRVVHWNHRTGAVLLRSVGRDVDFIASAEEAKTKKKEK